MAATMDGLGDSLPTIQINDCGGGTANIILPRAPPLVLFVEDGGVKVGWCLVMDCSEESFETIVDARRRYDEDGSSGFDLASCDHDNFMHVQLMFEYARRFVLNRNQTEFNPRTGLAPGQQYLLLDRAEIRPDGTGYRIAAPPEAQQRPLYGVTNHSVANDNKVRRKLTIYF